MTVGEKGKGTGVRVKRKVESKIREERGNYSEWTTVDIEISLIP